MSFGIVHAILIFDLNVHHITAKLVPILRFLALEQKQHCVKVGEDFHQHSHDEPTSMSNISDEKSFYRYEPNITIFTVEKIALSRTAYSEASKE